MPRLTIDGEHLVPANKPGRMRRSKKYRNGDQLLGWLLTPPQLVLLWTLGLTLPVAFTLTVVFPAFSARETVGLSLAASLGLTLAVMVGQDIWRRRGRGPRKTVTRQAT